MNFTQRSVSSTAKHGRVPAALPIKHRCVNHSAPRKLTKRNYTEADLRKSTHACAHALEMVFAGAVKVFQRRFHALPTSLLRPRSQQRSRSTNCITLVRVTRDAQGVATSRQITPTTLQCCIVNCNVCMFLLWLPYGVINYNNSRRCDTTAQTDNQDSFRRPRLPLRWTFRLEFSEQSHCIWWRFTGRF